jgi:4-aminobutyrate aminotransferase/(S)-3-amino-2-methylpropionate transaminase
MADIVDKAQDSALGSAGVTGSGIRLVTEVPGPNSRSLAARRDAAGARGAARLTDVSVASAHGAYVTDVDGNRLLDFAGGIGVLAVGHTPDGVVKALKEQAEKLVHMCAIVGTYEPFVELLERLVQLAPGDFPKKAVLLNSGAEALETAVKIARAHTGRQAIVVFEGGYHGRTNLTLGMTSKYGLFKKGFGPFASEIYRLPFPDLYRRPAGMSEEEAIDLAIQGLDKAMVSQVDPAAIAAFVIEPVQGEAGFLPVPARFLQRLRQIADESGAVLVADEVQSGMGRTGQLWAAPQLGVIPDLITTAKSLAAGMPLAAVVGRADIMDGPHPGGLGGTYSGNPLACVAALEALDVIADKGFLARARSVGERLRAGLERIAAEQPHAGEVRGLGPMLAIEFVADQHSKAPYPDLVLEITKQALARGLIVIRAGLYSNCIRLLPPLNLTDAEVDEGLRVLSEAVAAAVAKVRAA